MCPMTQVLSTLCPPLQDPHSSKPDVSVIKQAENIFHHVFM